MILECLHVIPSFFIAGDVALVHCTTWYTPGRRHRPQPGPDCLHGQPRGARLRRGRPSLKAQTHGAPVDLPASHIYDLGIRGATGGRGAPYRVHASRDAARLRGRCLMHADLLMHVKPSTTPQVVLPCQTWNLIAESWQKESFTRMIRATNFTQTPKKNKNEFWNCHLEMLGRVAEPIFTSPGQPSKSGTAWEALAISRPSLRGPQPRDVDALACAKEL